jgi:hypothetical protein
MTFDRGKPVASDLRIRWRARGRQNQARHTNGNEPALGARGLCAGGVRCRHGDAAELLVGNVAFVREREARCDASAAGESGRCLRRVPTTVVAHNCRALCRTPGLRAHGGAKCMRSRKIAGAVRSLGGSNPSPSADNPDPPQRCGIKQERGGPRARLSHRLSRLGTGVECRATVAHFRVPSRPDCVRVAMRQFQARIVDRPQGHSGPSLPANAACRASLRESWGSTRGTAS